MLYRVPITTNTVDGLSLPKRFYVVEETINVVEGNKVVGFLSEERD